MNISKILQAKIDRAVSEKIDIVPYDPSWPTKFEEEKRFLLKKFPNLITRIEHFGSTAVPGLSSKPVVDMLIEVSNLDETKREIVPLLESLGYDYFWRTDMGEPYAWFIKRDSSGNRTHHLHMVEKDNEIWNRLYFRDYLLEHRDVAREYEKLKIKLAEKFPNNREAYTKAKADFILTITKRAKKLYKV